MSIGYAIIILIILFILHAKVTKKKGEQNSINILSSKNVFEKILEIDTFDISYTSFSIPKKDGTLRQIEAPNANLKKIQKDILTLLSNNILLPNYVTGFRKKFSIKKNASKHIGKNVVINLDIKDFFMNVTVDKLRQRLDFLKINPDVTSRIEKLCFYNNHLPQGAPTSPFLANYLFIPVDKAIINLVKKFDKNATYSRYADNITISSNMKQIANIIRLIEQGIVPKFGYEIKKSKVNLTRKHSRQTVTGITVNEKISMPRDKFMKLRAKAHAYIVKGTGKADEIAGNLAFLYLLDKKKYWSLQKKYKKKYGDTERLSDIFRRNTNKKKNLEFKKGYYNPRTGQIIS